MTTRVSTNSGLSRVQSDLSRTFNRMSRTQLQISSTKRLQKPSDSPTDVSLALSERSNMRRLEQYATNATDAIGWLRVTDAALMDVQEQTLQAKVQLTSAISGAVDSTGREAIAKAIEGIRDGMIQLGNTTYGSRAVFSGTAAPGTVPYGADGTYAGDAGAVRRAIDDGVTLDVNVTGTAVFGTRHATDPLQGDIFQVLDAMAAAVRSGDVNGMQAAGVALDGAVNRISTAQVHVGQVSNQVEGSMSRSEQVMIDVKDRLSRVEDTDLAEAIISLKSDEAAYNAALAVTARVIQPSLLDFLR